MRDIFIWKASKLQGLKASWPNSPFNPPLVCARRMHFDVGGSEGIAGTAALEMMTAAPHLVHLSMKLHEVPTEFIANFPPLPHLTRLEIATATGQRIPADQALTFIRQLPRLILLSLEGLVSAAPPVLALAAEATATAADDASTDDGEAEAEAARAKRAEEEARAIGPEDEVILPVRVLQLLNCSLNDIDLLTLARSCKQTIRRFVLHGCKTVHKSAMVDALLLIGAGLRALELRSCRFADEGLLPAPIGTFFDRINELCPFILDLQICSDAICTTDVLSRALTRMPIRHVELNCRLPHFEPSHVVDALHRLPLGRVETFFIGPHIKWNADQVNEVKCVRLSFSGSAKCLRQRTGASVSTWASHFPPTWTSPTPPTLLHLLLTISMSPCAVWHKIDRACRLWCLTSRNSYHSLPSCPCPPLLSVLFHPRLASLSRSCTALVLSPW